MNDPLAELKEWWTHTYDDGGMGTEHLGFVDLGGNCRLSFKTWDDKDARALWRIEVKNRSRLRWLGTAAIQNGFRITCFSNRPFANLGYRSPIRSKIQI